MKIIDFLVAAGALTMAATPLVAVASAAHAETSPVSVVQTVSAPAHANTAFVLVTR